MAPVPHLGITVELALMAKVWSGQAQERERGRTGSVLAVYSFRRVDPILSLGIIVELALVAWV